MKKISTPAYLLYLFLIALVSHSNHLSAQCTNADFENGTLTGWTGTYGAGQCTGIITTGICSGCSATNPANAAGFNQGPNDDSPGDPNNEYSEIITTLAGGNDPNLTSLGASLPTVWPGGGSYSMRMGNMWQAVSSTGTGDGETMSFSFKVTPSNCNFTYYDAIVLNDGGHGAGEQAFFSVGMTDSSGNPIDCAAYQVDATTASTIGGFNDIPGSAVYWRPWSPTFVPLNAYIGQTVSITFTTRGCLPGGCAGSHYAYAYIDAACGPLNIVPSSPTVCGGQNITITAPAGVATYSWTGPGIVSGANARVVTVNQAGSYVVSMTTLGNTPCTFSLDTFIASGPVGAVANFLAPAVCAGDTTVFTDLSTPGGAIITWAWDFTNSGTTQSTVQNPTYIFPATGTYPVKLSISSSTCVDTVTVDTIINVVVTSPPPSTFTLTSPVCEGSNSTITYTGSGVAGDTYTWDFGGGTVVSGFGQGPYQVSWNTGGTKNVSLIVSEGACTSQVTTTPVVVNPFPGVTVIPAVSICAGGNVVLNANGATSYIWTPASGLSDSTGATVTASPDTTTTYTVSGVSSNCTGQASQAITTVTVNPVPTSTFTTTAPLSCADSTSTITYTGNGGGGDTYTWNFDGGTIVSGTGQGPYQVSWDTNGTKSVTLTVLANGCSSAPTPEQIIVNDRASTVEICIVSVDSATGKNMVIWNNPSNPAIDSFLVYKESSVLNVYNNIGGVSGTDFSTFIDTGSNPAQHSDRDQLVALDSCENLTAPSTPHQTIHLSVSPGTGNTWNLIWNAYEGFVFPSYYIYRAGSNGVLTQIDVVSSSITSYTDLTPPSGPVYYQVRNENPNGCNPSRSIDYSVSLSNVVNTAQVGIVVVTTGSVQMFSYNEGGQNIVKVTGSFENYGLKLYDITGRLILDKPNRNSGETILPAYLAKGVYVAEAYFANDVIKKIKAVLR